MGWWFSRPSQNCKGISFFIGVLINPRNFLDFHLFHDSFKLVGNKQDRNNLASLLRNMSFPLLSEIAVILHPGVSVCPETGAPRGLGVNSDGKKLSHLHADFQNLRSDVASLQLFFSHFSKQLRWHSDTFKILFKAAKLAEGPLSEGALKVRRVLTWGNVKEKDMAPLLALIQMGEVAIQRLHCQQVERWKELNSELSWEEFLNLRRKRNHYAFIYLAMSFRNPTIQMLVKLQQYLEEFGPIKNGHEFLCFLAVRLIDTLKTEAEKGALEIILDRIPGKFEISTTYSVLVADFAKRILYESTKNYSHSGFTFTPLYSPSPLSEEQMSATRYVSGKEAGQRPIWQGRGYENFHAYQEVSPRLSSLPKSLQKSGLQLIEKGQQKSYLSKVSSYYDFSRKDLMIFYFLSHSQELRPKEYYYLEGSAEIHIPPGEEMRFVGDAYRAYLEHDFEIAPADFETMVERVEIMIWKDGVAQRQIIDAIDPLTLSIDHLASECSYWINTLLLMRQVNSILNITGK